MADAPRGGGAAGGAGRGGGFGARGDRGGDRGRGRGRRGPRRGGGKSEEKEWQPVTKLGRLVKAGKITSMEQIYLHSLPIKEYQIVDFFLPKLKDEVMKVSCIVNFDRIGQGYVSTNEMNLYLLDQTRAKANQSRSTHTIQGHRCHWRFRGACWSRNQDIQRSRNRHPRRHHHRQTLSPAYPTRILGYQPRCASQLANEAEWKVWQRYCQGTFLNMMFEYASICGF